MGRSREISRQLFVVGLACLVGLILDYEYVYTDTLCVITAITCFHGGHQQYARVCGHPRCTTKIKGTTYLYIGLVVVVTLFLEGVILGIIHSQVVPLKPEMVKVLLVQQALFGSINFGSGRKLYTTENPPKCSSGCIWACPKDCRCKACICIRVRVRDLVESGEIEEAVSLQGSLHRPE